MTEVVPAIVVPAYNRPHALARLLDSLASASYPQNISVPLVISIDMENRAVNEKVRSVAESFHWQYGPKKIILHPHHLGLLQNFYYCGDLTKKYGSVIFLEDDLIVSPVFYHYAIQALAYSEEDLRIAGISLYRYAMNGYAHRTFEPLADGSDIFFMQVASIVGQAWTKAQWVHFQEWRVANTTTTVNEAIHEIWSSFDADDYFPILTNYLVSMRRFYVFPRISLTTGFGDPGTHFANETSYFQVPLQREQTAFRLTALETAHAVYDSFMEITPESLKRLVSSLGDIDFDVDLHATKGSRHLKAEYIITTRACKAALKTFALSMQPPEANIIFNMQGTGINLCGRTDIRWDRWSEFQTGRRLQDYFARGVRPSLKRTVVYYLLDLIRRFRS